MSLKIAVQMDPIQRINIKGDSTFALLLEAQKRGHQLAYYTPDRLALLNGRVFAGADRWQQLHNHIAGLVGDPRVATEAEVELDCDFGLKYEHVIEAITAVSGDIDSGGRIQKLVEKIKFSPPRAE